MRILYPNLVYGAIASSGTPNFHCQSNHWTSRDFIGVTHASIVLWEYMEIIRKAADPICSSNLEHSVDYIDSILPIRGLKTILKGLFGLATLEHDEDFASVISVSSVLATITRIDSMCQIMLWGV
jgi:hypothetical protein